jgi:methionyl-tRNA formyltransferase
VTTFKLADKVDTGNVYLMKEIPILDSDNFATLHDKLAILGSEAVLETINGIEAGNLPLLPQNNELATPAPKITKEMCRIFWNKSAVDTLNLIRGVTPFPGAYFIRENILYKIHQASMNTTVTLKAGEFLTEKDALFVGCSSGTLEILEIQKEGRKRMTTAEFLRGYKF